MACGRATDARVCPIDAAPTLGAAPGAAETPAHLEGYTLGEVLGRGGMGLVLAATSAEGQPLALKFLHRERAQDQRQVQRFYREAMAVKRIDSARVVEVLGVGVEPEGERPYLVMERVRAPTLEAVLAREGAWPLERSLRFVAEVAEGLAAAADAGVVHRDLKPANLFVTEAGARITDFGVAHVEDSETLTSTDVVVGTATYMAPEQIRGQPVDARTDVYALGCILYRLLRGRPPFEGERLDVLVRHLNDSPPALMGARYASAPPWILLDRLLGSMLAKAPQDRPTPRALLANLEAASLPSPPPDLFLPDAASDSTASLPRPRRRSLLWVPAAGLVVAAGVWTLWPASPVDSKPRPMRSEPALETAPTAAPPKVAAAPVAPPDASPPKDASAAPVARRRRPPRQPKPRAKSPPASKAPDATVVVPWD